MNSSIARAGIVGLAMLAPVGGMAAEEARPGDAPTFATDIAPIFFESCVTCHRPDHLAPMSLMTYRDARPWARAIKAKVVAREMPPWGAAPGVREYRNDVSLSAAEIETITAWVDGGAPEGDAADLPQAPAFADGWSIGEPDLVFTMLEPFEVPADGVVPYSYVTVPTNLMDDVLISAYEFRPGDRRALHHVISYVLEDDGRPATGEVRLERDRTRAQAPGARVGGYVPNRRGTVLESGTVSRLPAGADIEAQMHYTTIGIPVTDQSSWGVVLAEDEGTTLRRVGGGQLVNFRFRIPPGDPSYAVRASRKIREDTYLSSMMPHMHVRGKSAEYAVVHPDGRREVVLSIPRYDFNWQLRYELAEPVLMPAGSTFEAVFHYDNSRENRFNPDPSAEVSWGDTTWEEMMLGYYGTVESPSTSTTTETDQD